MFLDSPEELAKPIFSQKILNYEAKTQLDCETLLCAVQMFSQYYEEYQNYIYGMESIYNKEASYTGKSGRSDRLRARVNGLFSDDRTLECRDGKLNDKLYNYKQNNPNNLMFKIKRIVEPHEIPDEEEHKQMLRYIQEGYISFNKLFTDYPPTYDLLDPEKYKEFIYHYCDFDGTDVDFRKLCWIPKQEKIGMKKRYKISHQWFPVIHNRIDINDATWQPSIWLQWCHECDTKYCCNPLHGRFDTNSSNQQDKITEEMRKNARKLRDYYLNGTITNASNIPQWILNQFGYKDYNARGILMNTTLFCPIYQVELEQKRLRDKTSKYEGIHSQGEGNNKGWRFRNIRNLYGTKNWFKTEREAVIARDDYIIKHGLWTVEANMNQNSKVLLNKFLFPEDF